MWGWHILGPLLIFTLFRSNEGNSKCVRATNTQLCRSSCPSSCPSPSLCPSECAYCKEGYYGPQCTRRCKGKSHCLNDRCYLLPSGRALNCSEGCKQGWRGLSCNSNCKHPCLACDRYMGECIGPCRDGYFGSSCYNRCPETCVSCDKMSGSCVGECVKGFYGANCTQSCPDDCEECNERTGECVSTDMSTENLDSATAGLMSTQTGHKIQVRMEPVNFERNGDNVGQISDESFIIIVGVLSIVGATLITSTVLFVICRKYRNNRKTPCNEENTDSSEPLTAAEPYHIYEKIMNDPKKNPNHPSPGYITPIYVPVLTRRISPSGHQEKHRDGGYISPVYLQTSPQSDQDLFVPSAYVT